MRPEKFPRQQADRNQAQNEDQNFESANHSLVVLLKIHTVVQAGYLIVTVEHQRIALQKFSEPPFFCLAPARMVDMWIHIRIKTVLMGIRVIPRGRRLAFRKTNLHNRLGAFESIFPWDHNAQGSSILVRQHFSIHSETEQSQGM